MPIRSFATISSDDDELNRVQDNISTPLNSLISLPLSDSNLIQNVNLITGTTNVSHGLGRPLLGYIITKKNANVTIFDTQSTNQLKNRFLQLVSSGIAIVDLIVF